MIVSGAVTIKAITRKLNPLKPRCIVNGYKQLKITAPHKVQTVSTAATAANKAPVKNMRVIKKN